MNSLVGEGARAGDDTDLTGGVDVSGHDTDLALAWLDDTGAVGANESCLVLISERSLHANHVLLWNALSDADDERHLGGDGVENGLGGEGRRNEKEIAVAVGLLSGLEDETRGNESYLLDGSKDGETEVGGAGFLRIDATDEFGAVIHALLGVEGSLEDRKASRRHTVLPVMPWQTIFVFLSTQTLAVLLALARLSFTAGVMHFASISVRIGEYG